MTKLILAVCMIFLMLCLFLGFSYKIHKAGRWKAIVLDKGYRRKEARRYFWLAVFRERDAGRLITALPNKTRSERKAECPLSGKVKR